MQASEDHKFLCPVCGHLLEPGLTECPVCGTVLDTAAPETSAPTPTSKTPKSAPRKRPSGQPKTGRGASLPAAVALPEMLQILMDIANENEKAGNLQDALATYRRALALAGQQRGHDPSVDLTIQTLEILIRRTEQLLAPPEKVPPAPAQPEETIPGPIQVVPEIQTPPPLPANPAAQAEAAAPTFPPPQPTPPRSRLPSRRRKNAWLSWGIGLVLLVVLAGGLWGLLNLVKPTPTPVQAALPLPTGTKTRPVPTATFLAHMRVGLVTDQGGIDDRGFNSLGWKGVTDAISQLGVNGQYLESSQSSDYSRNMQTFLDREDDLIVSVGFLMGVDTATAAKANPNVKFAIVDYTYPDCYPGAVEGQDCGSFSQMENLRGLSFQTDQAAFLAGYLAAGMTRTGRVGTFGGMQIPAVTDFMKGYEAGILYYNQKHTTSVQLIGWDDSSQTGWFTGNFNSVEDGKDFATRLIEQSGVDIVFPVDGPAGFGSAAYCRVSDRCLIIGVDTDWFESAPEYADVELTSVLKRVDVAVFQTIQDVVNHRFTGGTVTYRLADGGVDLAPFHALDSRVPQSLKDELTQVKADLISGAITVDTVLRSR